MRKLSPEWSRHWNIYPQHHLLEHNRVGNPRFAIYLSIYLSIYISIYIYICLSIYLSIYLYIYICIQSIIPLQIPIHIITYIHYLHTYLHTCIHAYIHASTCVRNPISRGSQLLAGRRRGDWLTEMGHEGSERMWTGDQPKKLSNMFHIYGSVSKPCTPGEH